MLKHLGKDFESFHYLGKEIESIWVQGEKVWPEENFDGMILNITIPSNNFLLILYDYIGGSDVDNAVIDWGDNSNTITINSSTDRSSLSHRYSLSGDYKLKIKGVIKWKGREQTMASYTLSKCLTSIELPTNNSPIVDIEKHGFNYFNKLISIPKGLFDKCTKSIDFSGCFYYCTSLESIPENLFDNCKEIVYFSKCFQGCSLLQSIPEGLFSSCTKVTNFSNCFYRCIYIQSIPDHLFDNNTEVRDFSGCFNGCKSIQSIPNGLFDNNTEVTNFEECFNSLSIQSIPNGLFDKCTKVTNFMSCFHNCSFITSKLPELWISFPYAYGNGCFNYCDKAPNYADAYRAGWANTPTISLSINTLNNNVEVDLAQYIIANDDEEINIDYGDGSEIQQSLKHIYENKGEYIVDVYGNVEYNEVVQKGRSALPYYVNLISTDSDS